MKIKSFIVFLFLVLLTSCETNNSIVNNLGEREANEIIVFLASKGVHAVKVPAAVSSTAVATGPSNLWNITVDSNDAVYAMSILNQNGLPRRQGTTLLELFAKSGLMSSDREENIRFQSGLAEQLKNTIRKMDGVIDAEVQLSFPQEATTPGAAPPRITASVFVKHQGVMEDPNNFLETKIKRLVSGAITGLDFDSVSVISDRSRFTDISLSKTAEPISAKGQARDYVSVWSIVMSKSSVGKFRSLFIFFILLIIALGGLIGWLVYKFYPDLIRKSLQKIPGLKKAETKSE